MWGFSLISFEACECIPQVFYFYVFNRAPIERNWNKIWLMSSLWANTGFFYWSHHCESCRVNSWEAKSNSISLITLVSQCEEAGVGWISGCCLMCATVRWGGCCGLGEYTNLLCFTVKDECAGIGHPLQSLLTASILTFLINTISFFKYILS